jgi:hypothetical protein
MGMEEAVPHDERYKAAEEYMDLLYQYVYSPLDLGIPSPEQKLINFL